MLIVRKNQYHENDHNDQCNLYIQCYPHQATNDLLHRTGKNHFLIEQKDSPRSKDNPKQKDQRGRHPAT